MIEAGKKFNHLVQFDTGQPTSDLTYTLYGQDGSTILSESLPISSGQLSYLIEIPAGSNSLSSPLFEQRVIEYDYTTATGSVIHSIPYFIHKKIGFPVSPTGVREMLGMDSDELPERDIKLFEGYMAFLELIGEDVELAPYESSGDLSSFRIARAIEAITALQIFPTLQIRLPKKYDSGTSSYERWNSIDWEGLRNSISGYITTALELLDPLYEEYPVLDIFVLSDRGPDAITGA